MANGALQYVSYEPDTEVLDVPAVPSLPTRSRTPTDGALTMHVYQDGAWHRRTPDLATTSCALLIDSQRSPVRREELIGTLCTICFTAFECSQAERKNR